MNIKHLHVLGMVSVAVTLSACSEPPTASHLETNREQSKLNVEYLAGQYRAQNQRLEGSDIIARPDTHINKDCPTGDGWAEFNYLKVGADGKIDKIPSVASTYSGALGVYRWVDFEKNPVLMKTYGSCNTEVPDPILPLKK